MDSSDQTLSSTPNFKSNPLDLTKPQKHGIKGLFAEVPSKREKRAISNNQLMQQRSMFAETTTKSKLPLADSLLKKGTEDKKRKGRNSIVSVERGQHKRERSRSQHGSILEPQNKDFLKKLVKDDDKFNKLFLEGLESTAQQVDDQDKFVKRKQLIFIKDQQFEFSQYDPIFKLKGPAPSVPEKSGKKVKIQAMTQGNCFCCKQVLTAKVKQDLCTFCSYQGCKDCVYKQFPYPLPDENGQNQIGRICRVCEAKFYIKNKLDQIFKQIDHKEYLSKRLTDRIAQQQTQHMSLVTELQQQLLLKEQRNSDHQARVDQFKNKISDIKDVVERQELLNKKTTQRITLKQEEYEEKTKRIKQLQEEIEKTRRNLALAHQELEIKQADREQIKFILRQMNPTKKQPSQSSFNRKKEFPSGDDQFLQVREEANSNQINDHLSTASSHMNRAVFKGTPQSIAKSSKSSNRDFNQKSCCGNNEGCIIF